MKKTPDLAESQITQQPSESNTGVGVNTPNLDPKTLKVQRKAIASVEQAWSVITALYQNSYKRNIINAEISARYNGKQPYDPKYMKDQGRDWEMNFPTLFMAGVIDRIIPTLISAIDGQRYLTQAKLPEQIDGQIVEGRDVKSEIFREEITGLLRKWRGFRNFCASLCTEDVLIGYCFASWLDEDEIYPMFIRQDKGFVPEGSPQFSEYFQIYVVSQPLLLHFLVDIIQDRKVADDAGWMIDACVDSINNALPENRYTMGDQTGASARNFEDILREGNQGASFMSGAKVVELRHLFVTEPDEEEGKGRISHYILDGNTHKLLFARDRRFDKMSDIVAPFTLEPGNGKFYGAKGAGRILANYSIAVDATVCDMLNQVKMAGLKILRTDAKSAIDSQIKVKSPFIILPSTAPLDKDGFDVDVEHNISAIDQLTKMAEIACNAYIPNQLSEDEGPRRTAREATIDYTRELQSKAAFVSRFSGQFAELMNTFQKRACKKDTTHPDAKEFQKRLKEKGLSEKEIELLAASPAMETVQDLTGISNQQRSAIAAKYAGNPMLDQKKLLMADIIAMSDPEFAKEIILPDVNDPTNDAEQVRQQLMENVAIMNGESMPVSNRDNHATHLRMLIGELQQAGQRLGQQDPATIDPQILDHINAALVHGDAHIQKWQEAGASGQQVAPYKKFIAAADQILKRVAVAQQAAAAKAKQVMSDHVKRAAIAAAQQPPAQPPTGNEPEIWTERTAVAWITQFDKLSPEAQRLLEIRCGLGEAAGNTAPQPEEPEPEEPDNLPTGPAQPTPRPNPVPTPGTEQPPAGPEAPTGPNV